MTDTLPIAEITAGGGVLALAPCPGLARPLAQDIARIRVWGAGLVVTLIPEDEACALGVQGIGPALGPIWRRFPIADYGVPEGMAGWPALLGEIRAVLAVGGRVLVHCRGGLGRSGLVAALVLRDLGIGAEAAMAAVRAARPGAIETAGQEAFIAAYMP